MNAKKLLSLVFSAAFAVAALAGCGGSDHSELAARTVNEAQKEPISVEFTTDRDLTQSLKDALKDTTDPGELINAIQADENLADLLTGAQIDVYTAGSQQSPEEAAQHIANQVVNTLSGKQDKGYITMVEAEDGTYYAITLVYRTGSGSGSGSGNDSGGNTNPDPTPEPDPEEFTLTKIDVTGPTKKTYWVGEKLDTSSIVVTGTWTGDQGHSKTVSIPATDYTIQSDVDTVFDKADVGSVTFTVTYNDNKDIYDTFTVEVKEPKVDHIELIGYDKYEGKYDVGDTLFYDITYLGNLGIVPIKWEFRAGMQIVLVYENEDRSDPIDVDENMVGMSNILQAHIEEDGGAFEKFTEAHAGKKVTLKLAYRYDGVEGGFLYGAVKVPVNPRHQVL